MVSQSAWMVYSECYASVRLHEIKLGLDLSKFLRYMPFTPIAQNVHAY